MKQSDIYWITEEPSERALHEGVNAIIDCGLDGPDGVGPSDAKHIWQTMARAERQRFEAIENSIRTPRRG